MWVSLYRLLHYGNKNLTESTDNAEQPVVSDPLHDVSLTKKQRLQIMRQCLALLCQESLSSLSLEDIQRINLDNFEVSDGNEEIDKVKTQVLKFALDAQREIRVRLRSPSIASTLFAEEENEKFEEDSPSISPAYLSIPNDEIPQIDTVTLMNRAKTFDEARKRHLGVILRLQLLYFLKRPLLWDHKGTDFKEQENIIYYRGKLTESPAKTATTSIAVPVPVLLNKGDTPYKKPPKASRTVSFSPAISPGFSTSSSNLSVVSTPYPPNSNDNASEGTKYSHKGYDHAASIQRYVLDNMVVIDLLNENSDVSSQMNVADINEWNRMVEGSYHFMYVSDLSKDNTNNTSSDAELKISELKIAKNLSSSFEAASSITQNPFAFGYSSDTNQNSKKENDDDIDNDITDKSVITNSGGLF